MLETRQFKFEMKAEAEADGAGVVAGYGSVFDVVDHGGDIIERGAFKSSLDAGRRVAMLWQHDPLTPIGVWDEVAEDDRGLRLKGRLALNTTKGREAYELVKMGALDGLSIGYRTVEASKAADGSPRVIRAAELWEVSLVSFPMNESARIDAIKAASMTPREIELRLVRDAGFSRTVAKSLMSGGVNALKFKRDVDDEQAIRELRDALAARVSLKCFGA